MVALFDSLKKIWPPVAADVGYIGLDFSREECHLVQLEKDKEENIRIRAKSSVRYPNGRQQLFESQNELKTFIHKALKRHNFAGRKVVTAMPAGSVRLFPLKYHLSVSDDEVQVILNTVSEQLQGELTDYIIDYMPVRTKHREGDRLALLAVGKRNEIIEHLERLRLAGLEVQELEVGPVAIRRLVTAMSLPNRPENILVINFGYISSFLTVLSGRRLLLDQEARFGEAQILQQLVDGLGVSHDEARELLEEEGMTKCQHDIQIKEHNISHVLHEIVAPELRKLSEEVKRVISFYASMSHGASIDQIYIIGSIARWQGSAKQLEMLINIPVLNIPDPEQVFNSATDTKHRSDTAIPEIAVATGLALRGVYQYD